MPQAFAFPKFALCGALALAVGCGREETPPPAAPIVPAVGPHFQPTEPIEEEYEEVEFYDAYEHLDPKQDVPEDDPGAKLFGTEMIYSPCDDAQADTVLVVTITIPKVLNGGKRQYGFRRHRIISGFLNDVARNTQRSAMASADGIAATPEGFRYWRNESHSVRTVSPTGAVVRLGFSWQSGDGSRGDFDVELPFTIGEDGHKELDGGISFRWTFEKPMQSNDADCRRSAFSDGRLAGKRQAGKSDSRRPREIFDPRRIRRILYC